MSQSVNQNKMFLSSRSRSQQGLILSKYNFDYYIFWTADSLATRRSLMIGYHGPQRLVEKLGYYIQVRGHSEWSKCQCLPRWSLLNRHTFCYQTWYFDASSSTGVSCKGIHLLFSKSRSQQGLMWSKCGCFYYIFWIADPFATFYSTLSWVRVSYEEIGLLCSGSRSRQNFKMLMTVYSDTVFWNTKPFTTKLCTVMHHHEPNCLPKILVCCLQGQGQSEGSSHQIWLPNIFSELLILLQLNLVC